MTHSEHQPYIPSTAADVPKRPNSKKTDWSALERFLLKQLEDGPKTTRLLKRLGDANGWSEDQVAKAIATRWLDLPRHPGQSHYDPWTVYHPMDPAAARLGISHAVDSWLVGYLEKKPNGSQVPSKDVLAAAMAAGFDEAQLSTAYRRLQIPAVKVGRGWVRVVYTENITSLKKLAARS